MDVFFVRTLQPIELYYLQTLCTQSTKRLHHFIY